MYCIKLEGAEIDAIIWIINYSDPSWSLWKPLIDKIKSQCNSNEWQVAAHSMPDWSMIEWAYSMEGIDMSNFPLKNVEKKLQWEENLPPQFMENEENNWQV